MKCRSDDIKVEKRVDDVFLDKIRNTEPLCIFWYVKKPSMIKSFVNNKQHVLIIDVSVNIMEYHQLIMEPVSNETIIINNSARNG